MSVMPVPSEEQPIAHPIPQRPRIPPTLLPQPPSPMLLSTGQGVPAAAHLQPDPSPIAQQPPTPAASPVRSHFDPRWKQEFPSNLLYYTKDKASYDAAERYRTSSFYWQQAYMKTHSELSKAVEAVETRLADLERRFSSAEFAFMVCLSHFSRAI